VSGFVNDLQNSNRKQVARRVAARTIVDQNGALQDSPESLKQALKDMNSRRLSLPFENCKEYVEMKQKVNAKGPRVQTTREIKPTLESISGADSVIDYSANKKGARRVMASLNQKY